MSKRVACLARRSPKAIVNFRIANAAVSMSDFAMR
jgi:hypothetical protein